MYRAKGNIRGRIQAEQVITESNWKERLIRMEHGRWRNGFLSFIPFYS